MGMSLEKVSAKAPSLVKTAEVAVQTIDKARLNGQTAKVALVLDFSGSMSREYSSGRMQALMEKVLALATQFDDDGDIDFFVFDSTAKHLGVITLDNFAGAVTRMTKGRHMGTTNYAEAFLTVRDHFGFDGPAPAKKGLFGMFKKAQPSSTGPADQPVYALFLTDGDPDSEKDAVKALVDVSTAPIFWKFLSIGSQKPFLQKLDDLTERFVDNADYKPMGDISKFGEATLFDMLLEEFPEWLAEVRSKGLIK